MGDKVCAVLLAGGAFAEEAVANQNAVFALPPGSDEVAAAGLPVAYGAFVSSTCKSSKFLLPFSVALPISFGFSSDFSQRRRPNAKCESTEVPI